MGLPVKIKTASETPRVKERQKSESAVHQGNQDEKAGKKGAVIEMT